MAHVDNLRRHFPSLRHITYLNTGTCGALPDVTVERMKEVLMEQLQEGRLRNNYFNAIARVKQEVREQLASLFQVHPDNFALTENTTQAMNIVLWGLPFQPGDEIVYTDELHPSALIPIFLQKQRRGVVLKRVSARGTTDEVIAHVQSAISKRTRLVVCTHVCYQTGQRMPIEAIARVAHKSGVYTLVDGAQGAGTEPLDLAATGVDFYAFPGQKWLCGPDGTGALYVHSEHLSILDMTYAGVASLGSEQAYDSTGYFLPATHASRYEHARSDLLNWTGFLESLKFMRVQVGWDYVFTRIQGLSGQLLDELLNIPGATCVTPRAARAGIVSFQLADIASLAFEQAASERLIDVRFMPELNLVRVSTGFYNLEDEIQRIVNLAASH